MNGEDWFSGSFDKGVSKVFKNSFVESFVDADEYYADLRKEIEATNKDDLICWIGFDASGETPMPIKKNNESIKLKPPRKGDDKEWFDILKAATDRDVDLRVLLNLHPSPKPPDNYKGKNFTLVQRLNTLRNCTAINDFRYLWLNGTHHQKLVVISNSKKGFIAYCGTCDIATDRIYYKWAEVQCKITGDCASELFNVFSRRWKEHKKSQRPDGMLPFNIEVLNATKSDSRSGNLLIQIATTYGNANRETPFLLRSLGNPSKQLLNRPHRFAIPPYAIPALWVGNDFFKEIDPQAPPLLREGEMQSATYSFASNGHTGIYEMVKQAILKASQYIYMEDQYLVCDNPMGSNKSVLDLLIEKLKSTSFKKLIIFTTRIDDINKEFQFTGWKHRNNFITSLIVAGGNKVEICQYKSKEKLGCPKESGDPWAGLFYIHSKTWIFDDEFLITGSANCNRRGYSHDSELDIGVYDKNKQLVKDLRIRIWEKRLNTEFMKRDPIQKNELSDFMSAAKFWENPDKNGVLAIENSKQTSFAPSKYPDLDVANYIKILEKEQSSLFTNDPLGTWLKTFLLREGMDVLWDLVVDPDGV
jgi:phosphatidylserine/phosphatidylglycerophosphate/cardiolipin synthase-like enzyme